MSFASHERQLTCCQPHICCAAGGFLYLRLQHRDKLGTPHLQVSSLLYLLCLSAQQVSQQCSEVVSQGQHRTLCPRGRVVVGDPVVLLTCLS